MNVFFSKGACISQIRRNMEKSGCSKQHISESINRYKELCKEKKQIGIASL